MFLNVFNNDFCHLETYVLKYHITQYDKTIGNIPSQSDPDYKRKTFETFFKVEWKNVLPVS